MARPKQEKKDFLSFFSGKNLPNLKFKWLKLRFKFSQLKRKWSKLDFSLPKLNRTLPNPNFKEPKFGGNPPKLNRQPIRYLFSRNGIVLVFLPEQIDYSPY